MAFTGDAAHPSLVRVLVAKLGSSRPRDDWQAESPHNINETDEAIRRRRSALSSRD